MATPEQAPTPGPTESSPAAFETVYLADSPKATEGMTTFPAGLEEIYLHCRLDGVGETRVLRSLWQSDTGLRYQDSVTLDGTSTTVVLSWQRPSGGWPPGSNPAAWSSR